MYHVYFLFWTLVTLQHKKKIKQELHKRKVAQLELSVLQAQLNPHFIFNSLSGIQNSLHNNNLQVADRYIAEFAQLMRLFLESSKKKYINIYEEIDLLKKYTEMERRRFENRFDVQFYVEPDIDIDNSIIPTFLLQPFVENAINHGLFHKEEKGYLKITFGKYGINKLRISIEDNGVGREAVMDFQSKSHRKHKSRAGQIIQEKSEVLRTYDNYIIDINTIDLRDRAGNPTGTRVNIDIPEIE